jgi:hypothetical protein
MPQDISAARKFARRLIDCEGVESSGPTTTADAQRAAERVWDELSKWTGVDGCYALLTRAVALAKAENPMLLRNAKVGSRSRSWLDGIGDNRPTNGADAGDNGIESILTALIELLVRLVGDQIALNMLEPCLPDNSSGDGRVRVAETE